MAQGKIHRYLRIYLLLIIPLSTKMSTILGKTKLFL